MSDMLDDDHPAFGASHTALDAYWKAVGPNDPDFITYVINPQFEGKPAWPNTRQAYRVVRPAGSLIITSDGLSDPFHGTDDNEANGFEMEVFIETADLVGADFAGIRDSWAFQLIENFAMNVANWGGIKSQIEQNGVMSTEFPSEGVLPQDWLTESGSAGFLINLPVDGRPALISGMPFSEVLVTAFTLIHPRELDFIIENGAAGRAELADKLNAAGHGHMSSISRAPVV